MIKGKTKSGFNFKIDEKKMDDMEFLEKMVAAEDGDFKAAIETVVTVLGEKGKKELYDFLRQKDGRVPVDAFSKAMTEIFEAASEAQQKEAEDVKNS